MGGVYFGFLVFFCFFKVRGFFMVWYGGRFRCCWKMFFLFFSESAVCGTVVCSSYFGFFCLIFISSLFFVRGKGGEEERVI